MKDLKGSDIILNLKQIDIRDIDTFSSGHCGGRAYFEIECETERGYCEERKKLGVGEKVTESTPKKAEDVVQTWSKRGVNVGETEERILQQIILNPRVRLALISRTLKLPRRTIEDAIARLKSKGIIKRIGPDKGGHWEVK